MRSERAVLRRGNTNVQTVNLRKNDERRRREKEDKAAEECIECTVIYFVFVFDFFRCDELYLTLTVYLRKKGRTMDRWRFGR